MTEVKDLQAHIAYLENVLDCLKVKEFYNSSKVNTNFPEPMQNDNMLELIQTQFKIRQVEKALAKTNTELTILIQQLLSKQ